MSTGIEHATTLKTTSGIDSTRQLPDESLEERNPSSEVNQKQFVMPRISLFLKASKASNITIDVTYSTGFLVLEFSTSDAFYTL
jgi:hypothetical protein